MLSASRRLSLAAVAALAAASTTAAAPTATARSRNVTATLVAETRTLRPGGTLAVGLHLVMAPEWHTYWKNPGDSGLATRIQWRLPEGFEAGPILWPVPERMFVDPLMSYGYSGEVLLLTEIRTPAKLPAGGSVTLGAKVDWLECKDACLPGKAELHVELPVSTATPEPLADWSARFTATRRRLPAAPGGWAFEAWSEGGALRLAARPPAGVVAREAYFFPAQAEVFEHAAKQALRGGTNGFELVLPRAANSRVPERLSGVLVLDRTAVEIAVPVSAWRRSGSAVAPAAGALTPGALAASLPVALLLSFVGGVILNLMPCPAQTVGPN
jgi:thiol:disulfide interchange protein DsbD